jgi:hypothetical protein
VDASECFYRAAPAPSFTNFWDGLDWFSVDELWIDKVEGPVSRVHLAFQALRQDVVHTFHAAALAAGGQDNGAPASGGTILATT